MIFSLPVISSGELLSAWLVFILVSIPSHFHWKKFTSSVTIHIRGFGHNKKNSTLHIKELIWFSQVWYNLIILLASLLSSNLDISSSSKLLRFKFHFYLFKLAPQCFNWETFPIASGILTIGPQLVMVFWGSLGGMGLLEEVCHWMWALREESFTLLSIFSLYYKFVFENVSSQLPDKPWLIS